MIHSTQYWKKIYDKTTACTLCPRECHLKEGQHGYCFVRANQGGQVVLRGYGLTSGLCIDPIEKKPLYHFFPGDPILSLGTIGCNLGCKFCQNWSISKTQDLCTLQEPASPTDLIRLAKLHQCKMLAYTYNEPIVSFEYILDLATLARANDLHSVAVTAGYIQDAPREKFFAAMDAANVDLKSFSNSFYRDLVGNTRLEVVLETLLYIKKETSIWLEITNLLIPGYNDNSNEIEKMCEWIATHLGTDVPLHFSAFHPDWKLQDAPHTSVQIIQQAQSIAKKCGLRYVYVGNIRLRSNDGNSDVDSEDNGSTTKCSKCGSKLILRQGFEIKAWNISTNPASSGSCKTCESKLPGHFKNSPGTFGNRRLPVSCRDLPRSTR